MYYSFLCNCHTTCARHGSICEDKGHRVDEDNNSETREVLRKSGCLLVLRTLPLFARRNNDDIHITNLYLNDSNWAKESGCKMR